MSSVKRLHVGTRLSEAAAHNGTVYLAGKVPDDASKNITGQTEEVLGMIERLLIEAGSAKSEILMATIYLADLSDFDGMNAVWDAWVEPNNAPPRATVQAKLGRPDWRIEIVITAALI